MMEKSSLNGKTAWLLGNGLRSAKQTLPETSYSGVGEQSFRGGWDTLLGVVSTWRRKKLEKNICSCSLAARRKPTARLGAG
jgi:hypothetical protein